VGNGHLGSGLLPDLLGACDPRSHQKRRIESKRRFGRICLAANGGSLSVGAERIEVKREALPRARTQGFLAVSIRTGSSCQSRAPPENGKAVRGEGRGRRNRPGRGISSADIRNQIDAIAGNGQRFGAPPPNVLGKATTKPHRLICPARGRLLSRGIGGIIFRTSPADAQAGRLSMSSDGPP